MSDASTNGAMAARLELRTDAEVGAAPKPPLWRKLLATMGPGLMVCFADTDGSCLITAAESGSQWRYKLLSLQAILIPTLYFAQELTVRLALTKGKGLTAVVRDEAGPKWAWAIGIPLLLDSFLALISEIVVIGQTINACWGIPSLVTNSVVALSLIALAIGANYSVAEKVGLVMGAMQVLFFATMFVSGPSMSEIGQDIGSIPIKEGGFVKLVTANIGAVIMPWMLAYQQSALCEKGIGQDLKEHLLIERVDTAVGSFLTQGVMAAMLITVAARPRFRGQDIDTIDDMLPIFEEVVGNATAAKIFLTFAIVGACIVAAIVVSLCGAWTLEGAMGHATVPRRAVAADDEGVLGRAARNVRARPSFYAAYILTCCVAWFLSVATPDFANSLTGVWTQFINGILMPPITITLWYMCAYRVPEDYRLGPCLRWSLAAVFGVCIAFCLLSIPIAIEDSFFPQSSPS